MFAVARRSVFRVGIVLVLLGIGVFSIAESLRTATLMEEVEPAALLPLTIVSAYDANKDGLYRDYRLVGRLPGENLAITVKATRDIVTSLRPGSVIGIYRTYRPAEPYVTRAAYENARPIWTIAGITMNWVAALGAAFIAAAGLVLRSGRVAPQADAASITDAQSRDRFTILSNRFEAAAKSSPGLYKLRLFALTLVGYGFLALVLGAVLIALVVLVYLIFTGRAALVAKLVVPIGVLIYAIVRSLWVKLEPPDGIVLTKQNAASLFDFLDTLRKLAKGPRIHRVILDEAMNAAIVQIPRLGVLGWHRNYLVLGLPILQALAPEQMKAVIAHEYGHLAGAHGKFSAWIYRIRKTWAQLADQIAVRSQWSAFLFRGFFGWYVPYFNAYSFVLARANEYEADRLSAKVAGAEDAAAALIGIEMKAQRLSQIFWTALERQIERSPAPKILPHAAMTRFFAGADSVGTADELQTLLKRETSRTDTHPSLSDRLKMLAVAPKPAVPIIVSAATAFLGASLPGLVRQMDERWQSWAMPRWQKAYDDAAGARESFGKLRERAQHGPLNLTERREYARLAERFGEEGAAEALYRALLADHPADPMASYFLGQILLHRDDEGGLNLINAAMDTDANAVLPGCELAFEYLHRRGRIEEAARYRERWIERNELLERDRSERSSLSISDRLLPPRLSQDVVTDIVKQLKERRAIWRAYLVEKEMIAFPDRPLHILIFMAAPWPVLRRTLADLDRFLAHELHLPDETLVLRLDWWQRSLLKKVRSVPNALIFRR